MAVTFDTLRAATRLREKAGFSEKQATEMVATFADGFVEDLATKDDVEHLRGDVEKLRGDMEKLEMSLRGDMGKLENVAAWRHGEARNVAAWRHGENGAAHGSGEDGGEDAGRDEQTRAPPDRAAWRGDRSGGRHSRGGGQAVLTPLGRSAGRRQLKRSLPGGVLRGRLLLRATACGCRPDEDFGDRQPHHGSAAALVDVLCGAIRSAI